MERRQGRYLTSSTADLLRRRVPQTLQRRRAERQLDQVADQVTEKLQEFLRVEFRAVPENEITAATLLVRDLFVGVETDANFLLQADLDAVNVEKSLRISGAKTITNALLSPAGVTIFDKVLRETAAYVVEVFTALPDFQAKATRELLRRETAISAMVEQVLSRLPTPGEQPKDSEPEDVAFELRYRRSIARKLDRLDLFGAYLSEYSRRYTLSVAYISLTVTSHAARELNRGTLPLESRANDLTDSAVQRVEKMLGYGSQRVLISGEAGSGKTTLLRWLSVMAARKELSGGLQSWNDLIPIYLPLRRFARIALPRPEQYLNPVLQNLAGAMPREWMHRLLQSERALLLLDGLDELPAPKREEFRVWFEDLLRDFPQTAVVVTSRPAAVATHWIRERRIDSFELQPMSLQDVKSLIDHWHLAVAKDIDDEDELKALARYRENLKSIIEERRPIRALATNPLMCALMCALHRDRRAHLPRDRMELYRIALEMLLERRDIERQVPEANDLHLAYREKELLLEDLAYWLIRNGQSDATADEASRRIATMLPQIPRIRQLPAEVLTYLLERSGVIRSPTEGRIDFLHRSFQEFLAAKAAVKGEDIPLLVRSGSDDQWREVIILAAGHARPMECERLIRGLLDRSREDVANSHRLTLVAMACLETATQLSPSLRNEVEGALALVVPPRTQSDATDIAAAGELATPFLVNHAGLEPDIVAACVRALALIGNDESMKAIGQYAGDRRPEVAKQVISSWSLFPAAEYAKNILSAAPLVRGGIELTDGSYVEYLNMLKHLRRVSAERLNHENLRALGGLARIRHLRLSDINIDDFLWLTNQRIETLALEDSDVYSWDGIGGATGLRRISLHHCRGSMLGSLEGLRRLEALDLYAVRISSMRFIESCGGSLKTLSISECPDLTSLQGIGHLTGLENLVLNDNIGLMSVRELSSVPGLRTISLRGGYIRDLSPLKHLPALEVLRLDSGANYDLGEDGPEANQLRIIYSG